MKDLRKFTMSLFFDFRNLITDRLWLRALSMHRSRMGFRDSPRYTRYLKLAQHISPQSAKSLLGQKNAENFKKEGWASFITPQTERIARDILSIIKSQEAGGFNIWGNDNRYIFEDIWKIFPQLELLFRDEVGDFLHGVFGAHYKIFYGLAYRSKRLFEDLPQGSQLWHADGGPGTCINLMFCLTPSTKTNGTMELISWPDSLEIFRHELSAVRKFTLISDIKSKESLRKARSEYYAKEIKRHFEDRIVQPKGSPGIVYAFSNNLIHKGGFPDFGEERYIILFHIYPSIKPTPFETYRTLGIAKSAPMPFDPDF